MTTDEEMMLLNGFQFKEKMMNQYIIYLKNPFKGNFEGPFVGFDEHRQRWFFNLGQNSPRERQYFDSCEDACRRYAEYHIYGDGTEL